MVIFHVSKATQTPKTLLCRPWADAFGHCRSSPISPGAAIPKPYLFFCHYGLFPSYTQKVMMIRCCCCWNDPLSVQNSFNQQRALLFKQIISVVTRVTVNASVLVAMLGSVTKIKLFVCLKHGPPWISNEGNSC